MAGIIKRLLCKICFSNSVEKLLDVSLSVSLMTRLKNTCKNHNTIKDFN